MTAEPLAPGAPAIILFRQVDRDDNSRAGHEDDYFRIKILSEEGRKYADVEIPYFKSSENINSIRARTIRPDGSVVEFNGTIFDKSIAKAKGLKYLAKTFTLPDVQVGGIIEYSYVRDFTDNLIFDSHWILSQDLFTRNGKFSLKPYMSNFDPFFVRYSWQFLPAGTASPQEGPDHIIRLEAHNIPAFQTEDFMPPENELKARVDFIYSRERFESDPEHYWRTREKKMNDALEGFIGKKKAMEQAVSEIVSATDPPELKARKIYARVQQIRNTSYEIRKSEQEERRAKEKEDNNVEDVWKRGRGEGMQLTWLYLALARAAGIEAYGVWVSDRRNYFFNPKLMDANKLDANLVLLKLNGKDVFCDPGAAFTPFGLLPWSETNVLGLRMDKDGGSWVQTGLPESSASRIERRAKLKLDESTGAVEGKLTVTFTGLEALWRRVDERHEDEAERKKFLEDEVREYIPAAIDIDLINKPDWSGSEPPLVAEFDLKVPGWAASAGRRALIPVGLFSAPEKRIFDHAERVHPIYFRFPSETMDEVSIDLPLGWLVSSTPPAQDENAKVVGYTLKVDHDPGSLRWTRTLHLDLVFVDKKYYPALRNFFQVVRTADEGKIVLQPATATVN